MIPLDLTADREGERLDAFLARSVPDLTRSAAQRLLERGAVTLRGRAISHRRVMNAMTLTLMVVFLFMVSSMLLSTVDGLPFLSAAFEVASAMGTVGLTVGITPGLSLFSRGVLVFLMYVGRVGILSFSIAFLTRSKYPAKIKYPTFDIMIG